MTIQIINMIIQSFNSVFNWFFTLEISEGVYLGWIFVVVILIIIILKYYLKEGDNG